MALFYKNNQLCIGKENEWEKPLCELIIADDERPVYIYDLSLMEEEINFLQQCMGAETHIHYAVKANSNTMILQHFAKLGVGADVVSAGEARLALEAGFDPKDIIFSGVAKTKKEISFAIENSLDQINIESPQELLRVGDIARSQGVIARVAFRMNPDVNPQTHPYITTGFRENKFGMEEDFIPELLEILKKYSDSLSLQGLTIHIGSQLTDNQCFEDAIIKTIPIFQDLKAKGFSMKTFDVGGGIGINYQHGGTHRSQIQDYGQMVQKHLSDLGVKIYCEPGRMIVGAYGTLVSEVQYIKKTSSKNFAILNTGMHHLIRPALYQAEHRILPLVEKENKNQGEEELFDVVGPICESSDFFAKDYPCGPLESGDFLAIGEAGAYGRSMASQYNAHEYPREVVLYKGEILT